MFSEGRTLEDEQRSGRPSATETGDSFRVKQSMKTNVVAYQIRL
jgi:hypothetical protein